MKKKDIQDFKNKPDAELMRIVKDTNDELRTLRFDLAAGKVKDISKIREAKKAIARAQTFLQERKMNTQ
jgi:ribosomal protein L29